jgi:hypothetical protein
VEAWTASAKAARAGSRRETCRPRSPAAAAGDSAEGGREAHNCPASRSPGAARRGAGRGRRQLPRSTKKREGRGSQPSRCTIARAVRGPRHERLVTAVAWPNCRRPAAAEGPGRPPLAGAAGQASLRSIREAALPTMGRSLHTHTADEAAKRSACENYWPASRGRCGPGLAPIDPRGGPSPIDCARSSARLPRSLPPGLRTGSRLGPRHCPLGQLQSLIPCMRINCSRSFAAFTRSLRERIRCIHPSTAIARSLFSLFRCNRSSAVVTHQLHSLIHCGRSYFVLAGAADRFALGPRSAPPSPRYAMLTH